MRWDVDLATLLALGAILLVLSWQVAAPFWAYIVLGLLLATLAYPLHERLVTWTGLPRVSSAVTVLAAFLLLIVPVSVMAWLIIRDMTQLVGRLSVAQVEERLLTFLTWSHETFGFPAHVDENTGRELVMEVIPSIQAQLASWIPRALESTAIFLLGLIITVIVTYYALLNGRSFLVRFKRATPMADGLEDRFIAEAKATVDGVIWGQMLASGLQGTLGGVAFFVTGLPNAFFWGFVMAVLSFLPVVGAFLVWMPASVFLIATGELFWGIAMLVWGAVVISSVDNIIRPMVIGKSAALHPLLAFVGVLGGLIAFGIMGFLLGPLVLSLLAVVFNMLAESRWDLSRLSASPGGEDPVEEEGNDGTQAA